MELLNQLMSFERYLYIPIFEDKNSNGSDEKLENKKLQKRAHDKYHWYKFRLRAITQVSCQFF